MAIQIKTAREIELMRKAGAILGTVLAELEAKVVPGITPLELDAYAEARIREMGGIPGFKGHEGFPNTICANVNDQVVHTIPTDIPMKEGDIISIDCGVIIEGYYSDAARTYKAGQVSPETQKFIDTAYLALENAIAAAKPGNQLADISAAIDDTVSPHGYGIVKELSGHGIGKNLHEDPYVMNYRCKQPKIDILAGMTLAIEPIFNMGKPEIIPDSDGWTIYTKDNSLSIQVENTILITDSGAEILSKKPK